jgi:hypothetical protein
MYTEGRAPARCGWKRARRGRRAAPWRRACWHREQSSASAHACVVKVGRLHDACTRHCVCTVIVFCPMCINMSTWTHVRHSKNTGSRVLGHMAKLGHPARICRDKRIQNAAANLLLIPHRTAQLSTKILLMPGICASECLCEPCLTCVNLSGSKHACILTYMKRRVYTNKQTNADHVGRYENVPSCLPRVDGLATPGASHPS